MALTKLVTFASLLTVTYAVSIYQGNSYGRYVPVANTAHAPTVRYTHAPATLVHAPVKVEHHTPANYEFKYGVKDDHTHDIKEQAEKRVGDKVEGYYSLVEPDGTTRTVHYTADDHNGFNAIVSKSGHAVHPATSIHTSAAPGYSGVTPHVSYSHVPSGTPLVSHSHVPSRTPLVSHSHVPSRTPLVSYSHVPSGTPLVSYSHVPSGTPLVSHSHVPSRTPLVSYSHVPGYSRAAPAVSYSNTVGRGYPAGGLGHRYGGYH